MWIENTLKTQRKLLSAYLEPALSALAGQCPACWNQPEALDMLLQRQVGSVPYCGLLYAVDKNGRQISANVTARRIDPGPRGQDLSARPYADSLYPKRHFALSPLYVSHYSGRPCVTGMQPVYDEQQFLGFIMADFDLRDLPLSLTIPDPAPRWQPVRDWAGGVVDKVPLVELNAVLAELIGERGVFQLVLDYAASQVMLWHLDDPYQYRLHGLAELLDPMASLRYPITAWPLRASLKPGDIGLLLQRATELRQSDEGGTLQGLSLNTVNGMVGLSFSGSGAHHLPVAEFLRDEPLFHLSAPPGWQRPLQRMDACYM